MVPVYSSELQEDDARGTALAQEFQANILGLNMAFGINVAVTHALGKWSPWAWRVPILVMQVYPALLCAGAGLLPETPRWCVLHGDHERAKRCLRRVFGDDEDEQQVEERIEALVEANKREQEEGRVSYADMLWPPTHVFRRRSGDDDDDHDHDDEDDDENKDQEAGSQFHPTVVTVMGQVNQALTGYGAVSVYGPQIFGLLGFGVGEAEFLTLGNYVFYLGMMTAAWVLIDRLGRRRLMIHGAAWLAVSFALLTVLGGLASRHHQDMPSLATAIPGVAVLYAATAVFGIGWLVPPWLIPTEIYPSTARAQGAAVSVVVWGLANCAVTFLTPIGFNNLRHYLFLVFAGTNAVAGLWTYLYCPESGNRTFEENQEFFRAAAHQGSWIVSRVNGGEFTVLPDAEKEVDEEVQVDVAAGGGGGGGDDDDDATQHGPQKKKQTRKTVQKKMDAHQETTPLLGRSSIG